MRVGVVRGSRRLASAETETRAVVPSRRRLFEDGVQPRGFAARDVGKPHHHRAVARQARAGVFGEREQIDLGGVKTESLGVVSERADDDAAGFFVRRDVRRPPRVEAVERRAVFDRPVLARLRGRPARHERTETSVVVRRSKIRAC